MHEHKFDHSDTNSLKFPATAQTCPDASCAVQCSLARRGRYRSTCEVRRRSDQAVVLLVLGSAPAAKPSSMVSSAATRGPMQVLTLQFSLLFGSQSTEGDEKGASLLCRRQHSVSKSLL